MANQNDLLKFNARRFGVPAPRTKTNKNPRTNSEAYTAADDAYANKGMELLFEHMPSGKLINFKAFITSYNESFALDWASETVLGRLDPLYMFKQTTRSVTLGFKMPASTTGEGFENVYRLDRLRSFVYPLYADSTNALSIAEAPLVRISVLNLLTDGTASRTYSQLFGTLAQSSQGAKLQHGALAIIKNINTNFNLGNHAVFEAGSQVDGLPIRGIIPQFIEVSIDFTIIHDDMLGHLKGRSTPGVYGFDWENSTAVDSRTLKAQRAASAAPSAYQAAVAKSQGQESAVQASTDERAAAGARKLIRLDGSMRNRWKTSSRKIRGEDSSVAENRSWSFGDMFNKGSKKEKVSEAVAEQPQPVAAASSRGIPLDYIAPSYATELPTAASFHMAVTIPSEDIPQGVGLEPHIENWASSGGRKIAAGPNAGADIPAKFSLDLDADDIQALLNDWDAKVPIYYHAIRSEFEDGELVGTSETDYKSPAGEVGWGFLNKYYPQLMADEP